MATKFNEAQIHAIKSRSPEILVAAGAGSGKSTVLVERLMRKIIDEFVNVDEFLIVTFTNLAASEMVEKLRESLNDEIAKNPTSSHLEQQIHKLPFANISTFHSFCNKILQRYYYLVEMDANMQLMDDMQAMMLRAEVLDEFMTEMSADLNFQKLIETFGSDRNDAPFATFLMKIYEFSRANPNMDEWLENLNQIYKIDGKTIDGWIYYNDIVELISPLLEAASDLILNAKEMAEKSQFGTIPHGYIELSQTDLNLVAEIEIALHTKTYEDVRNILEFTKIPNFPTLSKKMKEYWDEDMHNQAKEIRNSFKTIIENIKKNYFAYSNESHILHFEASAEIVKSLAWAIKEFDHRFSAHKKDLSKLDFSDLERLTLKLLTENKDVLKEIASEFNEIMIDEYQDTNEMQERIVKLISEADGVPMFMVGDVKQSIYRFRLAEPSIFQGKYDQFKKQESLGEKIDLMQNYRSGKDVIDATNYIFKSLMDEPVGEIEYDEAAALKLGVDEGNIDFNEPFLYIIDKEKVVTDDQQLELLHDAELEAHLIANQIRDFIDNSQLVWDRKQKIKREINYSDIVILLRNMTASRQIFDVLTTYNIPVSIETSGNLLDEIEILTVISALRVIDNPYQDIPLVSVMRSPMFNFTETELAKIKTHEKTSSFYESLKQFCRSSDNETLLIKTNHLLAAISSWRYKSLNNSLAYLLRYIYESTSYYQFVLGLQAGDIRRANLDVLEALAEDYETSTSKGLYDFLHYIDHISSLGKSIPKAKPASTTAGVKIMTIHKSKGLEFPIVYLANIQKKFNIMDEVGDYVIHKDFGIGLQYIDTELRLKQKTIATMLIAKKMRNQMIAEEMRLLYVALTRSKSKLILTGVLKDESSIVNLKNKDIVQVYERLGASRYLDWLVPLICDENDQNPWKYEIIDELNTKMIQPEHQIGISKVAPAINLEEEFLKNYPLELLTKITAKQSVTQRKIEETVPLFKGIPERFADVAYDRPSFIESLSKATEIGTAFHQFMQHLPVEPGHTLESLENLRHELVEKHIIKSQLAQRVDINDIYKFTQTQIYRNLISAKKIHKELPFTMLFNATDMEVAKAMLQGVIDLLAEFDEEVWIVDYKTDKVANFDAEQGILRRRYDIQMKYYLQAARAIFPQKRVLAKVYYMKAAEVVEYG